ncbi:MAG: DNA-binding domain-containing protein [Pseudomonadota bacterium]
MSDQAGFANALRDRLAPCPAGLTTWNGSDPAARLAVYRNNVWMSLIDALADGFPVTQALVGADFFRAMAQCLIQAQLPRSALLAEYGADFPDFIAGFEPADPVPYLADVARLEWLRVRAYHAADADPVAPERLQLALSQPETLGQWGLRLHPALSVLASDYAVVALWAAHQGVGELGAVDPSRAETALVLRAGLEVEVIRLAAGAAGFIQQVLAGACLGAAVEQAMARAADFDFSEMLALLLRAGAITDLVPPQQAAS